VHKDLISSSSEFFKNATKPEWRTDSKPIDLSDELPRICERYFQWLYTGTVAPHDAGENGYRYLARMYVLGEKMMDQTFQNDVIKAIITRHSTAKLSQKRPGSMVLGLQAIKIIYDGTTENAPVRRLLVDIWTFNMVPSWISKENLLEQANKPFFDDLFLALLEKRGVPDPSHVRPWISQPSSYYNKVVVPKSDMARQEANELFPQTEGQDEMDVSGA
jgi:hypothetical protein